MRCIFCKEVSENSKSVEHIIPESLGNTDHVLSPGIVCDNCNNYFSRKIESPLLSTDYFVQARFNLNIASKKKRIPILKGIHFESATAIGLDNNSGGAIYPLQVEDGRKFIDAILRWRRGKILIPFPGPVDRYLMSRFIGKVSIEALAQRLNTSEGLNEIVEKEELDPLRKHVRYGDPKQTVWPFTEREIHPASQTFFRENYGHYEVLHEYQFVHLGSTDLWFVLCIFGVEYVLNMDRPDTSEYTQWLLKHNGESPLYPQS